MADDNLGYCSAEGGYVGASTWDTYDLLREEVELEFPRDRRDSLFQEILHRLPDHLWCEIDPYSLDTHTALSMSWERFCKTIKFERRFFFHGADEDSHDSYAPVSLLKTVAEVADNAGLITTFDPGTKLWRVGLLGRWRVIAADFGPPPAEKALQSNRMNPAGIPMMYLASNPSTALREAKQERARVGQWQVVRPLRILDLRKLPEVPGFFSDEARGYRLILKFLHRFCRSIMQPIDRTERVNIDYLPSQVATEFFRDFPFQDGPIDGVAYGSTVSSGWNVVLFAGQHDLGINLPTDSPPDRAQRLTFKGAKLTSV